MIFNMDILVSALNRFLINHESALFPHEDPPFCLLIKPAGADCNLRCTYCFYLEKCNLYPGTTKHRMPDSVLEKLIQRYMATPQSIYSFGWQGGEPTLMGLDCFRRVTDLQKTYGKTGGDRFHHLAPAMGYGLDGTSDSLGKLFNGNILLGST
jgi:sulfatase maturation enzyme AslB (radical SAM superfamily)